MYRWIAGMTLVISAPAAAQDETRQSSVIADAIAECMKIVEPSGRLACFDVAAKRFVDARDTKQIVVLDRSDVRRAKRSLFGFSLPKIKLFGGSDSDEPEVLEIESTLTSFQPQRGGLWRLSLADNTIWQTTESAISFIPRKDSIVKVEAGILGSYSAKVGNNRMVKVKRLR